MGDSLQNLLEKRHCDPCWLNRSELPLSLYSLFSHREEYDCRCRSAHLFKVEISRAESPARIYKIHKSPKTSTQSL